MFSKDGMTSEKTKQWALDRERNAYPPAYESQLNQGIAPKPLPSLNEIGMSLGELAKRLEAIQQQATGTLCGLGGYPIPTAGDKQAERVDGILPRLNQITDDLHRMAGRLAEDLASIRAHVIGGADHA